MNDSTLTLRACVAATAVTLASWLLLSVPVGAQDAPPADDAAADVAEEDLDGDGEYDPADEVFAPTEAIRADSEISFPSDI